MPKILQFSLALLICGFLSLINTNVFAAELSEDQLSGIKNRCDIITYNLKQVQKRDAKARVHLGGYYETISTDYMTPLNVRLVENGHSSPDLLSNQITFTSNRDKFNTDYINYQKSLEELISIGCKTEPEKFYTKLEDVRAARAVVETDVSELKSTINAHIGLVYSIKESL